MHIRAIWLQYKAVFHNVNLLQNITLISQTFSACLSHAPHLKFVVQKHGHSANVELGGCVLFTPYTRQET
jgi:hypothetical protein